MSEIYQQRQMNNGGTPPPPPFNSKPMWNLTQDFPAFILLYRILGLLLTVTDSCHLFLHYIPSFFWCFIHSNTLNAFRGHCYGAPFKTNNFYTRLYRTISLSIYSSITVYDDSRIAHALTFKKYRWCILITIYGIIVFTLFLNLETNKPPTPPSRYFIFVERSKLCFTVTIDLRKNKNGKY